MVLSNQKVFYGKSEKFHVHFNRHTCCTPFNDDDKNAMTHIKTYLKWKINYNLIWKYCMEPVLSLPYMIRTVVVGYY